MREQSCARPIASWMIPSPNKKENYFTPCYEQLIGAGYSFYKADEHNFQKSTLDRYDVRGLSAYLSQVARGEPVDNLNWVTWERGFYFNSALHRTVWACDRLLAIFGWLPLKEGPSPGKKPKGIEQIKELAKKREEELRDHAISYPLDGIKKSLECLKDKYKPTTPVSETNFFTAIRWRVNIQKHALKGLTHIESGKSVKGSWKDLGVDKQWKFAMEAFNIVSDVYRDIHHLYFKAEIFNVPTSL